MKLFTVVAFAVIASLIGYEAGSVKARAAYEALEIADYTEPPYDSEYMDKRVIVAAELRELETVYDLPVRNIDTKTATSDSISAESDALLASGLFRDPVGLLLRPQFTNWKTLGPMHDRDGDAKLVEVRFDKLEPTWYRHRYAYELLRRAGYYDSLNLHDLVNLVSKHGSALPSGIPIVALGSVTAYQSFYDGSDIQSPAVIKKDGRWEIWDLRIAGSGPGEFGGPTLFLVDVETPGKASLSVPKKQKVSLLVRAGDVCCASQNKQWKR